MRCMINDVFETTLKYTRCYSLVDITYTGIIGTFRKENLPYATANGDILSTQQEWETARNQQRNWETMLQLISLRCQPVSIEQPIVTKLCPLSKFNFGSNFSGKQTVWEFKFSTEYAAVYDNPGDRYGALKADADNVPVITGLNETAKIDNMLVVNGSNTNIYFERV